MWCGWGGGHIAQTVHTLHTLITSHSVHASHTLHTGHYIHMRAIQKCVKGCDFGRLEGDFCPQPLPSSTPPVLNHSPPQPLPSLTPLVLSPSRPQPLPSSTPPCHNPSPSQPLPPPLARLGPKSGWSRLGPKSGWSRLGPKSGWSTLPPQVPSRGPWVSHGPPLHRKTKLVLFSFMVFGFTCPRARLEPRPPLSKGAVTTASATLMCTLRNVRALVVWI